jgi:hypothetical protein
LIDKTVKDVGPSIYLYNYKTNNCQIFLKNILSSNGLGSSSINSFIMQDIEKLVSTSPDYVDSIANFATEAHAKLDRLVEGEGRRKRGRPRKTIAKRKPMIKRKINRTQKI